MTFSGALAWPFVYPWPQRPAGLIDTAFDELARRWKPILDEFDKARRRRLLRDPSRRGPVRRRDLRDVPRQARRAIRAAHQLRSLAFRAAASRLSGLHRHLSRAHQGLPREGRRAQSDRPPGRLFGLPALGEPRRPFPLARRRPGRFQGAIFSKLAQYDYDSWAVLEWECCLKHPEQGAAEGAPFIAEPHHPRHREGLRRLRRRRRPIRHRSSAPSGSSKGDQHGNRRTGDARGGGRIRLGMVGGGQGAFIGAVHRLAARMDDQYEFVAGALSTDAARSQRLRRSSSGSRPTASMPTTRRWRASEAKRTDGIEAVAIVTPNHLHCAGREGVHRGRHPRHLRQAARAFHQGSQGADGAPEEDRADLRPHPQLFGLSDDPPGARDGARAASSARLRVVQAEYPQDWLTTYREGTGQKQAAGAPIRATPAPADASATSARTPTSSPASSRGSSSSRSAPSSPRS